MEGAASGYGAPGEYIFHIVNGQKVKLIIETEDVTSASDILKSTGDVYADLSKEDISEIEDIAFD